MCIRGVPLAWPGHVGHSAIVSIPVRCEKSRPGQVTQHGPTDRQLDPAAGDLHSHLDTVAAPLNALGPAELNPGAAILDKINQALR